MNQQIITKTQSRTINALPEVVKLRLSQDQIVALELIMSIVTHKRPHDDMDISWLLLCELYKRLTPVFAFPPSEKKIKLSASEALSLKRLILKGRILDSIYIDVLDIINQLDKQINIQ
jgi:hypothetical protein